MCEETKGRLERLEIEGKIEASEIKRPRFTIEVKPL
jgi:hypothetical protein